MEIMEITGREIGMVQRMAQRFSTNWGHMAWRDDLVGSGLLGVVEAAGRFDPARGAPFPAVAAITARGRMLDALRKESRGARCVGARTRPDTPGGEQVLMVRDPGSAPPPSHKSSFESTLTRRELVRALRDAIETLPPRERTALRGCLLEGRPSADLAEELGVSRRAVNLMCARAKLRLREQLKDLGDVIGELLG